MIDEMKINVRGTLKIFDEKTGKVIRQQNNQIHPENMSIALGLSMASKEGGPIEKMAFGSGGAVVNGIGNVTYLSKNVVGTNSTLYSQSYDKIVDDSNIQNVNPERNKIEFFHVDGNIFSDIMTTCTLELSEPSGQGFRDESPTTEDEFIFDEIGLVGYNGKLLSHVIFNPVQKSANRVIIIRYTVRFQVA